LALVSAACFFNAVTLVTFLPTPPGFQGTILPAWVRSVEAVYVRTFLLSLVALVGVSMVDVRPVAAAPRLSAHNPYRSFNISGVNYGSMQWEQSHHGTSTRSHRGGLFFRRR
jgi:hypothetical protein